MGDSHLSNLKSPISHFSSAFAPAPTVAAFFTRADPAVARGLHIFLSPEGRRSQSGRYIGGDQAAALRGSGRPRADGRSGARSTGGGGSSSWRGWPPSAAARGAPRKWTRSARTLSL